MADKIPCLCEGFIVICALLSGTSYSNLTHSITSVSCFRCYQRKVKVSAFVSSVRIHLLHQSSDFPQCCVHPENRAGIELLALERPFSSREYLFEGAHYYHV